MDNYHITKQDDDWKFRKQGSKRTIKSFEVKTEAMNYMRKFMSNKTGSVKIHKTNGQIQEERTYPRSADPRRTKG